MTRLLFALLPLLLASGPPTPAQTAQAGGAQALPTAREVIDRHAAACNLRESLARTHSMHLLGRVSIPATGAEGKLETWSAKPALSRSRIELGQNGTVLGGFDGSVAWMVHSSTGPSLFQGTDLLQSRLEADWNEALKEGEAYESLRTVGRERFEGKECWKLEVVARPLPGMDAEKTREARRSHEYYELETGLLAGKKSRQEGELGTVLSTSVFSDYRDFGGRRMAAKTVVRQGGLETVATIESVDFEPLSPGLFRPPAEIQALLAARPPPVAPR